MKLDHPNIIKLREVFQTASHIYLVFDHLDLVLSKYIEQEFSRALADPEVVRYFMRQLVSALHHCHSKGIVHRDLSTTNIMYDIASKSMKIIDFRLSRIFSDPTTPRT